MNDEFQKQIAQVLKKALESAQQGGQWLAGQIPDVLNQLLVWNIAMGVFGLLILSLIIWAHVKAWRAYLTIPQWKDYLPIAGLVQILAGIASTPAMCLILDGMKALIAPKLFLLEYAAHLLK